MKKEIYIQIPEPCHEDWGKMSPVQQGRYCQSCSKEVVDFSVMTDQEIIQFLSKPRGRTCGNFASDQLERIIKEPATPAKKKYWAVMFSFLLPLLVSIKSQAQFRKRRTVIPETEIRTLIGDTVLVEHPADSVKGKVIDEDGNALKGVTLKIKGKEERAITNDKGEFTLPFKGGEIVLMVTFGGYIAQQLPVFKETASQSQTIILQNTRRRMMGKIALKANIQKEECTNEKNGDTLNNAQIVAVTKHLEGELICLIANKTKSVVITGKVTDEKGNPIEGATILIKGTNQGVAADANGNYTLTISKPEILIIGSVGYQILETEITPGNNPQQNFTLRDHITGLFAIAPSQNKKITINGRITDSSSNPIPFATVQIKGTHKGTTTDANGYYRLADLKPGEFSLAVSSLGYKNYEVFVPASRSAEVERDIVLQPQVNNLEEVWLIAKREFRYAGAFSTMVTRSSIVNVVVDTIQNIINPSVLKVYPNPASKNQFVNVQLSIPATYQLRLMDNEGKLILQSSFTITAKRQAYQLELASTIAAGLYFINVIDEKSKKQYTQKLIIQ